MGRDRNDRGRYADGIDPETVMDVFDDREDTARPVTATDVVDELGIARRTAHNKLNALVERGELDTRKIGARGRVWWVPNPRETGGASARDDGVERAGETPADPPESTRDDTHAESEDALDDARERIRDLDGVLAGDGRDFELRTDAVVRMYEHLRENPGDRLQKGGFADLLDGTDVGYGAGFSSLWANWVKADDKKGRPNLLTEFAGVERRGDAYVFTGDT